MYKLVAVGGKLRGTEYNLAEGENIIGRDSSLAVSLAVDGVSKKHMNITVNKESAYLEDLGSSNGTFLNGKLVKKANLKNGDKIALPNLILQVVYVQEKKVIVKKKVTKNNTEEAQVDDFDTPPMPAEFMPKILYIFKYKLMPILYTFNKEYEWRSIVAIILTVYILITIGLTIFPVLVDNKKVLLEEIKTRGFHYAADIARLNAVHLSRRNLDSLDTNFLEHEAGVESYELFDTEGRIVRPMARLNEYTTDTFSINAREAAVNQKMDKFGMNLGDGKIGIAQTIKAYNVKKGEEEPVGIIAIKFAPRSLALEAANNSKAYLESFTTSALVGILLFAMIYFLTIKHLDDLRFQIENTLRGKQKEITSTFMWLETTPLKSTINSLVQKVLEFQNEGKSSDMADLEEDGKYVEILRGFFEGSGSPTMILNSEKLIMNVNPQAEDITGIRESAGSGMSLLDVARDQGFAATLIELCDQSANSDGRCQKGSYELTGKDYAIYVNALMGKDHFAKAFYVTFVNE